MKGKLIFVLPDVEGGVVSVVSNLLSSRKVHERTIWVVLLSEHKERIVNRNFNADNVLHINIGKEKSLYKRCKAVCKYIGADDIIVSNDGGVELDAVRIFRLRNPVIYIMHGDFDYYYNRLKKNQNIIDRVITVSSYLKDQIIKRFPILKEKVENIYFPTPTVLVPKDAHSRRVHDNLKIIFIGALIERKGVHLFPGIVEGLISLNIDFELTIVGEGYLLPIVNELAIKFSNVHFKGSLSNEDILRILPYHDILLLPSNAEGLPVCVVEGMKAGLAIVSSKIKSGIPELVLDGKTGYMVSLDNPNNFSHAIKKLQDNKTLLYEMGENSRELANLMFDPDIQATKYFSVFEKSMIKEQLHENSNMELLLALLPDRLRVFIQNVL